jgi:hypothetical protein
MAVGRDQYSRQVQSSGATPVSFGFVARQYRIYLDTSGPVYVRLGTTGGGSTGDFPMSSGDSPLIFDDGYPIAGLGLASTTTAMTARVLALGG